MDTCAQLYLPRPDPEDCKCDVHGLENKKTRYIGNFCNKLFCNNNIIVQSEIIVLFYLQIFPFILNMTIIS